MYLKSLSLHGFKSFPSSVVLQFNKGITSVVGPNGSGKSNVSDAIRWVLGEQSAKSLRGGKMEDVIFFGTQSRKSVGYCEVTMTLDNADRLIKMDFDEISITRRQTRNGESNYKINGVNARLKDVLELFMDTGIGKEGYSIIGQGKIEEILKAKSDERRLLFEEATGIVKYKSRRTEANNKLNKEKENLIRVDDILKELETQVGPLKEQSEKAKEYLTLYEEKKQLHIALFLLEVTEAELIYDQLDEKVKLQEKEITSKNDEYNQKENTIIILKEEQISLADEIKLLQEELSNSKENYLNKNHSISLLNEKTITIESSINRLLNEIEIKKENTSKSEEFLSKYNDELLEKTKEVNSLEAIKEEKKLKLSELLEDGKLNDDTLKNLNQEILVNTKEFATCQNNIQNEEEAYEKLNEETESIIDEIKLQQSILDEQLLKKTMLEKTIIDNEEELSSIKSKILSNENKSKEAKELSFELFNKRNEKNALYQQKNAKLKALEDANSSHLGYYDSVKFVLNESFNGVLGTVGDVFSVEDTYELALETILSSQVQNIITKTDIDAKNIINILREQNKGRATFLPLNKVKTYQEPEKKLLNEKGVIGFFKDLVSYDEMFEPVASSLLQNTLVIDTLENAVSFTNKHKNKIRIVTLTGDVLSTTGSMAGGSSKKNQVSIFKNKRILKELQEEVKDLNLELDNLEKEYNNSNEKVNRYKEELAYSRDYFNTLNQTYTQNKSELQTSTIKWQYAKEELSKIANKDEFLLKEIESKNILISKLYEEFEVLKTQKDELSKTYEEYVKSLDFHKDKKEEQQNEINKIEISIGSINEEIRSIKSNIDREEKNILSFNEEILSIKNNISNEEETKKNIALEIENMKDKNSNLFEENENLEKSIFKKEAILKEKSDKQSYLEDSNKNLYKEISQISMVLSKDEATLLNTKENIKRLYDSIWSEYELTLQACKEIQNSNVIDKSYDTIKKEFNTVKNSLKKLGNVNVSAIEQYKEVSERYEFLIAQRADLDEARLKLNTIIKDLTSLMEEQFITQFDIIRENFKEVFVDMFEGGEADLVLTDKDDPLNSPIEIYAQPPGKKLKNLILMSGGEKSLTAICLLFGILKMKPSPFCVLDEIEAALDDANVNRYASFLKEFSKETQFILITHRKGTMVIADTLYGVTMEEMGISKLVSVKLTDYYDED